MVDSLKTLEKKLLEDRRKQLKKRLLQLSKELRVTELGASKVNSIKTKAQWIAALKIIEKEMVTRGSKYPKTKVQLPRMKELLRFLKPKWDTIK